MEALLAALVTVLAWGAWVAPSQNVPLKGQQTRTFYTSLAVLVFAFIVAAIKGFAALDYGNQTFWGPLAGGVLWAVSCWCAFIGVSKIGMAKAFGIWAPMNIIVGIIWGIILEGAFSTTSTQNNILAVVAILIMIGGIILIVTAGDSEKSETSKKDTMLGLIGTAGAGVGFATYYIPIKMAKQSYPELTDWVGTYPLAVGMFVGALILVALSRSPLKLEKPKHYPLILLSGILWGLGNFAMLVLVKEENLGNAQGFAVAQMCMVVNALLGVFIFKTPAPRSKAAIMTLIGVAVAAVGGVIFGIYVQS